jgi:hypothetical protein
MLSLMKNFIEEKYVLGMYVLQQREVFEVTTFVEIMHNDAQVVELDATTKQIYKHTNLNFKLRGIGR